MLAGRKFEYSDGCYSLELVERSKTVPDHQLKLRLQDRLPLNVTFLSGTS